MTMYRIITFDLDGRDTVTDWQTVQWYKFLSDCWRYCRRGVSFSVEVRTI